MAEQNQGGGSRVALVVDIVSDERAWAMFAAAALQAKGDAKKAAELADEMHDEWRDRFRGGEEGEQEPAEASKPADAPKPAVTAATRKAPNLLDEDD